MCNKWKLLPASLQNRGHNVEYYNDSAVTKVALTIDDAPSKSCSHFRKVIFEYAVSHRFLFAMTYLTRIFRQNLCHGMYHEVIGYATAFASQSQLSGKFESVH